MWRQSKGEDGIIMKSWLMFNESNQVMAKKAA